MTEQEIATARAYYDAAATTATGDAAQRALAMLAWCDRAVAGDRKAIAVLAQATEWQPGG